MPSEESTLLPEEISFADQARKLREQRGWSQTEVADRLRSEGLAYATQTTVSRIEKRARGVRMIEADRFARIFGVEVREMYRPDPRDVFVDFARADLQAFRRARNQAFANLKDAAEGQTLAGDWIDSLRTTFPDLDSLDEGTRLRVAGLIAQLTQFRDDDFARQALSVIKNAPVTVSTRTITEPRRQPRS